MKKLTTIYKKMLNHEYVFETPAYADAINALTAIDREPDGINMLYQLAYSNHFAHTFALSYILENTSNDFLLSNRNDICQILKIAVAKKYFRANFYFCNVLIDLMQDSDDYQTYLNIINAPNEIEHNNAIYHLIYLNKKDFLILDGLSDYDFSVFDTNREIDKKRFTEAMAKSDWIYQKILLTSVFYQTGNKEFVYSLTDQTNPDLFDFVFFFPNHTPPAPFV